MSPTSVLMIRTSNGRGALVGSSAGTVLTSKPTRGAAGVLGNLRRRKVAGQRGEPFAPVGRHQQVVLDSDAAPTR